MMLKFTKMHGLGNDFAVVDMLSQRHAFNKRAIKRLADRNFGIGFDQLLVVEQPQNPDVDFRYRIYNADGGEVQQCGNGARCFARFVTDKKLTGNNPIRVETDSGILELEILEDQQVRVNMGVPELAPKKVPFKAGKRAPEYSVDVQGQQYRLGVLAIGNPHAVLQLEENSKINIHKLGKAINDHEQFPEGVNVGFMRIKDKENFDLRVVERGVGETLACGSGACAAMVVGRLRDELTETATAKLRGGNLQMQWQGEGKPVFMTGPAATVYEGQIRV